MKKLLLLVAFFGAISCAKNDFQNESGNEDAQLGFETLFSVNVISGGRYSYGLLHVEPMTITHIKLAPLPGKTLGSSITLQMQDFSTTNYYYMFNDTFYGFRGLDYRLNGGSWTFTNRESLTITDPTGRWDLEIRSRNTHQIKESWVTNLIIQDPSQPLGSNSQTIGYYISPY